VPSAHVPRQGNGVMADHGFTFDRPYALTCPECGGALFPAEERPYIQFRCHIGHKYIWTAFVEAHQARIEATLGTAMVLMKERAELCRQLVMHSAADADVFRRMEEEATKRAEELKNLLEMPWLAPPKPNM
jgi:two-component system chemotaxis response regulator CheB